jgi:hypothetical protein
MGIDRLPGLPGDCGKRKRMSNNQFYLLGLEFLICCDVLMQRVQMKNHYVLMAQEKLIKTSTTTVKQFTKANYMC